MATSGRGQRQALSIVTPVPWGERLNHSVSTLDLLGLPLSFTQMGLLTTGDFIKQARERDVFLLPEHLVELHRARALVPFLRILRSPRALIPVPVAAAASDGYRQYRSPLARVIEAAQVGRLSDPGRVPFRAWGRGEPLRTGGGIRHYPSVFYSPYQLLVLEAVKALASHMHPSRSAGGGLRFTLDPLVREDIVALDACRRLAVLLSALDMHYLPDIRLTIHHADVWEQEDRSFDVAQRLALFGISPEALASTAKNLLFRASVIDPLGRWYDVVRHAHPDTWSHLRGAALLAMDYRMASELLLSALDDLGRTDLSTAPARAGRMIRAELDDRLRAPPDLLEQALTDRGLSPQPALLLVLEGDTEALLMPRVLEELYGAAVPSTLIQCVNMQTIDRDLDLLVRHQAGPRLGKDVGDGVLLARPPTHILVAVDREKRFKTKKQQQEFRDVLVGRLHESLPPALRTEESRRELGTLVEITDWGRLPWEFANFTDVQLAEAIIDTVPLPVSRTRDDVIAALRSERAAQGRSPDVRRISAGWARKIRKPVLAEALWPRLQGKVARAAKSGSLERLPAARVALRALTTATSARRRSVYLRVR